MRGSRVIAAAVLVLAVWWLARESGPPAPDTAALAPVGSGEVAASRQSDPAAAAFARGASNEWMEVSGTVDRLLADDNDGSRHQRFILRTSPDHTVLVAHNIDLAPRLEGLRAGDALHLRGEYEWNDRGGGIHWTHHDPQGRLAGGFITWKDRRYE